MADTTNNSSTLIPKLSQSESFPPDDTSPPTNVFTNAPFTPKSKSKQRSTATNKANTTSPLLLSHTSQSNNKANMMTDIEPQQYGYSNLSFNDAIVDDYF